MPKPQEPDFIDKGTDTEEVVNDSLGTVTPSDSTGTDDEAKKKEEKNAEREEGTRQQRTES